MVFGPHLDWQWVNLSLFEPHEEPAARARLADRLRRLAADNVWIGTSSWKYEGWLGQIYTRERYFHHGRFSRKKFEATCLAEYAETFPIVCGDFSFYQFPSPEFWQRLFETAPPQLRFAFKVPEEVTVRIWPSHDRYGPRAGMPNESFLNAELFEASFLDLLRPYGDRVAALIFEFGSFSRNAYPDAAAFVEDLDPFLAALPESSRYSVEVRNPEYLERPYFDCLRRRRVAHVFNAWTKMPDLPHQIGIPDAFTTDFTVTRALLRRGRAYEQAVKKFTPYQAIADPNPEGRSALRTLIQQGRQERRPTFLFVNNRFEGNAPGTIETIINDDP